MRLKKSKCKSRSMRYCVRWGTFSFVAAILTFTILFAQAEWIGAAANEAGRKSVTLAVSSPITTHLYEVQVDAVELEEFPNWGGAIESLGDGLLVATPRGRLALIDVDGQVKYLPQKVPMNEAASEGPILWTGFRVADILLHEREPDLFTLFVSHHYFTESCVEFRVSSISVRADDTNATLTGSWDTVLIVNPCISSDIFDYGHRGGFRPADAC